MSEIKIDTVALVGMNSLEEIRASILKDDIYQQIVGIDKNTLLYNDCSSLESYSWYFIVKGQQIVGVICFRAMSVNCMCFHAGIYKEFRGKGGSKYIRAALDYVRMLTNRSCKMIAMIANSNSRALKSISKYNFKPAGMITNGAGIDNNLYIFEEVDQKQLPNNS